MTFYTSYYANKLIKDYVGYGISNSCPVERVFALAVPSWQLVSAYKAGVGELHYRRVYLAQLDRVKDRLLAELAQVEHPAVFLCFEKPPKFCHRQVFAEWLVAQGFQVQELPYAKNSEKTQKG